MIITKFDIADIDGYDWNWSEKYLNEFADELSKAYTAAFVAQFPDASIGIVQREAAEYARTRGEIEITAIAEETKNQVRGVVQGGLQRRIPVGRIIRLVGTNYIFSALRAERIARTEAVTALGQGAKGAAKAQGRDEKRWVTQGDDLVSDDCLSNETGEWIPIADPFPSGVDTIPQHQNCRCNVRYRTKELGADVEIPFFGIRPEDRAYSPAILRDFRCGGCKRLLGRDVHPGTRIHCRHCKEERVA